MELIRIANFEEGAAPLLDRLRLELQDNKRVLWLVPGGSNIPLSVKVMNDLPDDITKNLTIYLTDERFGPVDHADSNTWQLSQAGFAPKRARLVNVLAPGLNLEETVEQYALSVSTAFEAADVVIAQMGMGTDGHICGILPGSPAVGSGSLVAGYDAPNFTRITLTPLALRKYVDAAYVFAFGDSKREALANLLTNKSLDEQPSQILRVLPEAYVYNDQIEGEA